MTSFTVTTPETSVNLRPSSVKPGETAKGTANYSVTNRAGATVRTRLRVVPGEGADPGWFTVRDSDERDIAPGATANFSIDLEVPGGVANHSFKVLVVNTKDTDNDFEYGSTIAFDAPAIKKNGNGFKWWMIAVPIALLVVVGGAIWGFIEWSDEDTVILENFVGSPLEEATATLEAKGIAVVEQVPSQTPRRPELYAKVVVDQDPESDGTLEIPQDTQVTLGWEWQPKGEALEACNDEVQGKIAWNYSGNKRWAPVNIARLCRGAEASVEPARCFQRVMHGGVNWGVGTSWEWENAVNLCEGTRNANAAISCFEEQIANGVPWRQAIDACDTR